MRRTMVLVAIALHSVALNAHGQIVTPVFSPPPCQGRGCLTKPKGATVVRPVHPGVKRTSCPQGTIYDPKKGTCHVMRSP